MVNVPQRFRKRPIEIEAMQQRGAAASRQPRGGAARGLSALGGGHHLGGHGWPAERSLALIPQLYAVSLAYGVNVLTGEPSPAGRWRVRNVVRWVRPNPPVGALGDKVRPATSEIIIACRDGDEVRRWFDLDAERVPVSEPGRKQRVGGARVAEQRFGAREVEGRIMEQNPAGAPLLDWWEITPGGYTGAHYAVFPVELPRRLVSLMCPFEVCRQCGEPRRRITAVDYVVNREGGTSGKRRDLSEPNGRISGTGMHGKPTMSRITNTVGWSDCGHGDYRHGVTLDPFGGSGTTAVAAAMMGRDSLLIDLDERNVDLARERLRDSMLLLGEQRDGDTVTWTVDATLPGVKGEHPGQQSLFAEAAS